LGRAGGERGAGVGGLVGGFGFF